MRSLVDPFLEPLYLMTILVVVAAACIITGVACSLRIAHGRKPSFWWAALGSVTAALAMIALHLGEDLFHPAKWGVGKADLKEVLIGIAISVALFAALIFIPASVVVLFYRRKA